MGRLSRSRRQANPSFCTDRSVGVFICVLIFVIIFGISVTKNFSIISSENVFLRPPKSSHVRVETWTTTTETPPRLNMTVFDENIVYNDFDYLLPMSLTYKRQIFPENNPILYRLPQKRSIIGLLLIFHGCGRTSRDWFHTIERQRIVGTAIDLGLGCLAFESTDKEIRCWSASTDLETNPDVQMVSKGLESFYEEHEKLKELPIFTFGASSGGLFSSIFATNPTFEVQGQILFISFIQPALVNSFDSLSRYPPTAWIYMSRDIEFASIERIKRSIPGFVRRKIPNMIYDVQPISLTVLTFHKRIPSITESTSAYIFYQLMKNKWLDDSKRMIHNPRSYDEWNTFLFETSTKDATSKDIYDNLKNHQEVLKEFLNTVYGEHEISFERSYEALKWLLDTYAENKNQLKEMVTEQ